MKKFIHTLIILLLAPLTTLAQPPLPGKPPLPAAPGAPTPAAAEETDEPTVDQLVAQAAGGELADRIAAVDSLSYASPDTAPAAIAGLLVALADEESELRWRAARSISSYGPMAKEAMPALSKALEDETPSVRAYAAFALGGLGAEARAAAPALIKQVTDEDPLVRRAVRGALIKIKPNPELTIPIFVKMLEEAEPAEVMPALATLAEGGAEVVPVLRKALGNDKAAYWATLVLTEIGPDAKDAVPELSALIASDKPPLRMHAVLALGEIGPGAKAAVPALVKALENDDWASVRYSATYALASIGDADASSAAIRAAGRKGDDFQAVASAWALVKLNPNDERLKTAAIKLLLEGLKNSNAHVRRAAARALFEIKASGDTFAEATVESLADADPQVVANAVESIVALGPSVVPQVTDGLASKDLRNLVARILYRLGPDAKEAVPALVTALETAGDDADSNEFRYLAQFTLGRIGPASAPAVPLLLKSLASEDEEVRVTAIFALAKIGPAAKEAVPALMQKVKEGEGREKLISVWALMKIETGKDALAPLALPLLVKALESEREFVRVEAAIALGELGPLALPAIKPLQDAQADDSPAVKEAVAAALKAITGEE